MDVMVSLRVKRPRAPASASGGFDEGGSDEGGSDEGGSGSDEGDDSGHDGDEDFRPERPRRRRRVMWRRGGGGGRVGSGEDEDDDGGGDSDEDMDSDELEDDRDALVDDAVEDDEEFVDEETFKARRRGRGGGAGGKGRGGKGKGSGGGGGGLRRRGRGKRGERPSGLGDRGSDSDEDDDPLSSRVDFRREMSLKSDHANRPLWVCSDCRIFLEVFSPVYKQAYDFLIAIAEPVCRPYCIHEYALTPYSLYAAVSVGLETETIVSVLERLSKNLVPASIREYIAGCTDSYGKAKLVLRHSKVYIESPFAEVIHTFRNDAKISDAIVGRDEGAQRVAEATRGADHTRVWERPDQQRGEESADGSILDASTEQDTLVAKSLLEGIEQDLSAAHRLDHTSAHSLEIVPMDVERVKQRGVELDLPMLEEYDFRADTVNPDLEIALKPTTLVRPYQERSLSKMFGNGRARSGIIVLPCGAGKSLVGVAAAAQVRKGTLVLCTNSVSVDQWAHQFKLWSTVQDGKSICRFTSLHKEWFTDAAGVCCTTYNMIAYGGNRSDESQRIIDLIRSREWGLMVMDEVHVVPSATFRRVVSVTPAHCRLGLTATLVREDERIRDLNFLIGPKLYEANWLDLQRAGYLASVSCAEVWCPMTREFYKSYLKVENERRRALLYVCNPLKLVACEFLVRFHEERGDKIIIFCDNLFLGREFSAKLRVPFICGEVSHRERSEWLYQFKKRSTRNTIILSKVGDTSIDLPEANVIIQISSHAGSRRQEAQRLGRILRPKPKSSVQGEEFNAFFYSLVSTDTQEMYYSTKRQQFLIDQGYAFKIVTGLLDEGNIQGALVEGRTDAPFIYAAKEEQRDFLAKVLACDDSEARFGTDVQVDDDGFPSGREGKKPSNTRSTVGMTSLTGAKGLVYEEYARNKGSGTRM